MECQKQTIDNEIIKPRQFQFVTFEKPPATETLLQTHAGDVCAQSKKIPRSQHHIILHINSSLNYKFSSISSYFLNLRPICSIRTVEKCVGDERGPCEMHAKVVGAANQCEKHPKCA